MPTCKLNNCPFGKDGRCLEGRGPTCPNIIPDVPPDEPKPEKVEIPPSERLPEKQRLLDALPLGSPLEVSETIAFSRRGRAIVIALAGMPECGKTSLLARLHQLFQAGPVAGYDFAGSSSLPRFEELNWKATFESGVPSPVQDRSSQFENSFLHIAVRSTSGGQRIDMLFNDIPGETFREAIAAKPACDKLISLARADHLIVLVDGAALADPSRRFHHIGQVKDFLQRVIQGGQCGKRTALHLIVSKVDELAGNTNVAQELERDVTGLFRDKFGDTDVWRIAARPMNNTLPTVEIIADLFKKCASTSCRYTAANNSFANADGWRRDFCAYGQWTKIK